MENNTPAMRRTLVSMASRTNPEISEPFPRVDPTIPPSRIKRLTIGIALSKPGTWLYINVFSRLDPWLIRLTRGRVDSAFGYVPILLMTARGARTGTERTVPLLYFSDGNDVVLMASSFGRPRNPGWYYNAKASGQVRLYRRGHEGWFTVEEVRDEERGRLFDLASRLYRGYGVYEQRAAHHREIPVLKLSPVTNAAD
jgi:deazaflavin-dependent oxidoreductase (nitroreductase family)